MPLRKRGHFFGLHIGASLIPLTGEFMGRAGATVESVVGIIGAVLLFLFALGAAMAALVFLWGAPHAFPPSPGIAAIFFLVALSCAALGIFLLRRSARSLSST